MTMRYRRPPTPRAVERQLRQEAGFGCARCGHPYIEYHHIVPWNEEHHFRADDMVAVCGTCHRFLSSQGRDRQYKLKNSAINVQKGFARGFLEYDKRDLVFRVGGNWYENQPVMIRYKDIPLVSCRLDDGQALVSLNLFNSAGRPVLQVRDSEVAFRLGDFWDFECKSGIAIARSGPRDIALKMDFSGADATIEARLWAGDQLIRLDREHSNIGGSILQNCRFANNGGAGIQIG